MWNALSQQDWDRFIRLAAEEKAHFMAANPNYLYKTRQSAQIPRRNGKKWLGVQTKGAGIKKKGAGVQK